MCHNHDMSESAVPVAMAFELQASWEIDPRAVPSVANQVMLRVSGGDGGVPQGVQLTFGYVNGPVAPSNATREQIQSLVAPIVPVGDIYLPLEAAAKLHEVLGQLIADNTSAVSNAAH